MDDLPAHSPPSGGLGRRHVLGFLLFFVALGALPPEALYWDDIGFLARASATPIELDYGHVLYLPLLRLWYGAMNALGYATWEYAAKVLSTLGGATFFLLLWRRLERSGLDPYSGLALALVGTTTPLLWRQAGIIEPTTWCLASLLAAAALAERYGARRSAPRALALVVLIGVLLGFHVVSVFALPWLAWLARGPAPRPPRSHLLVPAGAALLVLGAVAVGGHLAELPGVAGYWTAFLPTADAETLGRQVVGAWELLFRGFPGVVAVGLLGILACAAPGNRARLIGPALLGLPYLLALLLLGAPRVGLSVPVGVALTLAGGQGFLALVERGRVRLAAGLLALGLPLLVAVQVGQGMLSGLERARTPDDLQVEAELLAGALPRDAVLLAGPVAHHVRWFTGAPVVALPNELHTSLPAGAEGRDVAASLLRIVERERERYAEVYLASEALDWLVWQWETDPSLLPLDPEAAIVVRRDPPLALVPFRETESTETAPAPSNGTR